MSEKESFDSKVVEELLSANDPAPMPSAGDIPDGHKGAYEPNVDELVAGARAAVAAEVRLAEAKVKALEDRGRALFTEEGS
jgi:hypothetical protein